MGVGSLSNTHPGGRREDGRISGALGANPGSRREGGWGGPGFLFGDGAGGHRMARALIVVDFEEEWRTKGSDYYLGEFGERITNTRKLIAGARRAGIQVLFTRHIEPGSTTAFAKGSPGVAILTELEPRASERVFEKNRISPFYRTGLEAYLVEKAIADIIVCGIMTNLCVRSLVSDAYDREMAITVASDACVSDSEETDRFTFDDLRKTRPEVKIARTEEILHGL